jgi:hypothetical protein
MSQSASPFEVPERTAGVVLADLALKLLEVCDRVNKLERQLSEINVYLQGTVRAIHEANNILASRIDLNDKGVSQLQNTIAIAASGAIKRRDQNGARKEVRDEGRDEREDEKSPQKEKEVEG